MKFDAKKIIFVCVLISCVNKLHGLPKTKFSFKKTFLTSKELHEKRNEELDQCEILERSNFSSSEDDHEPDPVEKTKSGAPSAVANAHIHVRFGEATNSGCDVDQSKKVCNTPKPVAGCGCIPTHIYHPGYPIYNPYHHCPIQPQDLCQAIACPNQICLHFPKCEKTTQQCQCSSTTKCPIQPTNTTEKPTTTIIKQATINPEQANVALARVLPVEIATTTTKCVCPAKSETTIKTTQQPTKPPGAKCKCPAKPPTVTESRTTIKESDTTRKCKCPDTIKTLTTKCRCPGDPPITTKSLTVVEVSAITEPAPSTIKKTTTTKCKCPVITTTKQSTTTTPPTTRKVSTIPTTMIKPKTTTEQQTMAHELNIQQITTKCGSPNTSKTTVIEQASTTIHHYKTNPPTTIKPPTVTVPPTITKSPTTMGQPTTAKLPNTKCTKCPVKPQTTTTKSPSTKSSCPPKSSVTAAHPTTIKQPTTTIQPPTTCWCNITSSTTTKSPTTTKTTTESSKDTEQLPPYGKDVVLTVVTHQDPTGDEPEDLTVKLVNIYLKDLLTQCHEDNKIDEKPCQTCGSKHDVDDLVKMNGDPICNTNHGYPHSAYYGDSHFNPWMFWNPWMNYHGLYPHLNSCPKQ